MNLKIRCINSIGREMITEVNKKLPAGQIKVELTDQNLIPGVYLMYIQLDDYQVVKRFVISNK